MGSDWLSDQKVNKCADWSNTKFPLVLHTSLQAITSLIAAERELNWSETTVAELFTISMFWSPRILDRVILLMLAIFGIPASASVFLLNFFWTKCSYQQFSGKEYHLGLSLSLVVLWFRNTIRKTKPPHRR